jgi:hypothetical protein
MTYNKIATDKSRLLHPEAQRRASLKYKYANIDTVRANNLLCQQKRRLAVKVLKDAFKELRDIDLFTIDVGIHMPQ